MKRNLIFNMAKVLIVFVLTVFIASNSSAGRPMWTFKPLTDTTFTITANDTATVQYEVTNHSKRQKTLVILPTQGVVQSMGCVANPGGTCLLELTINGEKLPASGLKGGPALCQANTDGSANPNQCYQPSSGDILNITVVQAPPNTTLTPLTQTLALSTTNYAGADPALVGNPRIIRIENTGSIPANNVQVSTSGVPAGTSITNNDCTGTLNASATCDITITPGGTASPDNSANACTISPGTEPEPTIVTVSADNAPSTNVNVLVLGYGCIYQGGFLFSVDDSTPNTGSISGKVAALTDEEENPGDFLFQWATVFDNTSADSITDGLANTNALASPAGQYPAAQACLNKSDQGFTDWFMPAICELGRFVGLGSDAGCGTTNPNLYTTLHTNNLGGFASGVYWSSTEFSGLPTNGAWGQDFVNGGPIGVNKFSNLRVRCVRAFTP